MSLLLSEGHSDAANYPLGMVDDEVEIIISRINGFMATEGVILQSAGASIMTKKGGEHFQKLIKSLSGD